MSDFKVDIKEIAAHYDERAKKFNDFNAVLDSSETGKKRANIWYDYLSKRLVADLIKPFKTDVILDFGCGTGRICQYLSPWVSKIYGLDVSPELLVIARREAENRGMKNIEFLLNDAAQAAFSQIPDASVDKAFCYGVICHINDELMLDNLQLLNKKLKAGGTLTLIEHVAPKEPYVEKLYCRRTMKQFTDIIEKSGMKLVSSEPVIRNPSYAMGYWKRYNFLGEWALPFLYSIEKMTVKRKPEFIDYSFHALVCTPA